MFTFPLHPCITPQKKTINVKSLYLSVYFPVPAFSFKSYIYLYIERDRERYYFMKMCARTIFIPIECSERVSFVIRFNQWITFHDVIGIFKFDWYWDLSAKLCWTINFHEWKKVARLIINANNEILSFIPCLNLITYEINLNYSISFSNGRFLRNCFASAGSKKLNSLWTDSC